MMNNNAQCSNCKQYAVSAKAVFKVEPDPPAPTIEQLISWEKTRNVWTSGDIYFHQPLPIQVVATCKNCGYTVVWNQGDDNEET